MKIIISAFLLVCIFSGVVFGHACHDPWRPTGGNAASTPSLPPPPPAPPPEKKDIKEAKLSFMFEKNPVKVVNNEAFNIFVNAISLTQSGAGRVIPNVSIEGSCEGAGIEMDQSEIKKVTVGKKYPVSIKLSKTSEAKEYKLKFKATPSGLDTAVSGSSELSAIFYSCRINLFSMKKEINVDKPVFEQKITIQNPASEALKNVKLIVDCPAFDIAVTPEIKETVKPGEITSFTVKMTRKSSATSGSHKISIKGEADGAEALLNMEEATVVLK
ncbi:MAG: hypothetical protein A2231_00430 [Candidatus Firestonebacteria bacterium RIFOXYA2_FULL_40_8]|nr:MAG: hypothetical protein A2231_00430 [Candidatus Firestonebacteria bacterium RIFOXYA2_FULL_40_8]